MKIILLIDFGSTFTKVTAVDLHKEILLGCASSFTTIDSDINIGLKNAIKKLEKEIGKLPDYTCLACSSAAGGLRMIVSGLVENVTAKAAKEASLGAGAKVIKTYAYELSEEDLIEIDKINPEILLLSGGTDGGDKKCILHNATIIAKSKSKFPIIIAGNKEVSYKCKNILKNKETYVVENVMPQFGKLNINSAQNKIREIFLKKIIYAKGISKIDSLISEIIMPTPSAVMKSLELLSSGYEQESGIGELMAIDLGGATTDIYSIGYGNPQNSNVIYKGIEEPYVKRTVEGDIGMRYSIDGIVDYTSIDEISKILNLPKEKTLQMIEYLKNNPHIISSEKEFINLDLVIAAKAIEIATKRHCGTREEIYTSNGVAYLQNGKDLTSIKNIIATGGALIHLSDINKLIKYALYDLNQPYSLKPKKAKILVDKKYILSAMGLLSKLYPEIAIRIMKKELKYDRN